MPTYQAQSTIDHAKQATINPRFRRAQKYYESYMNICRAVFNCLNNGIDDAFKVLNIPALVGWNPLMEPREIYNQIWATYERPTPAALLQNDTLFWSAYSPLRYPRSPFSMHRRLKRSSHSRQRSLHCPATSKQRGAIAIAMRIVYLQLWQLGLQARCQKGLDQPQNIHPRIIHVLIERNQHHGRIARICPKRLCCPRGGIQKWRWWRSNCHHTDGSVEG